MSSLTEKDLREIEKEVTWHCCGAIGVEASIDGEEVDCQLYIRRGSIAVSEEIIPEPLKERGKVTSRKDFS